MTGIKTLDLSYGRQRGGIPAPQHRNRRIRQLRHARRQRCLPPVPQEKTAWDGGDRMRVICMPAHAPSMPAAGARTGHAKGGVAVRRAMPGTARGRPCAGAVSGCAPANSLLGRLRIRAPGHDPTSPAPLVRARRRSRCHGERPGLRRLLGPRPKGGKRAAAVRRTDRATSPGTLIRRPKSLPPCTSYRGRAACGPRGSRAAGTRWAAWWTTWPGAWAAAQAGAS